MTAPQNPAGPYAPEPDPSPARRAELIAELERAPAELRQAVAGLSDADLETVYRAWTIRQIVHHLADSHVNCYIRFKWALTEDVPTIKAYDEGRWAALVDSRTGNIEPTLALYEALHRRWVLLLRTMTDADFARSFVHPETGETVPLGKALGYYAWHARHHTAQIRWLRDTKPLAALR